MPDPAADATVTAAPPPPGPEPESPDRTATLPDQPSGTPSAPGGGTSPDLQPSQPQTAMLPENQPQAGPTVLMPKKRTGLGGLVDEIRDAIAGTQGRDVYVDENGNHYIQHPYLTGKQQWMKIGSEALAGAARGLAAGKGAGNMGRGLQAAVEGQQEDQQKLASQQDEDAEKNFNDQRTARIEKANAQMQQMQIAEMALRHSREGVQASHELVQFSQQQDEYYGDPKQGGIEIGTFKDASNIHDLEKLHPGIWNDHYNDNSIRVVPQYDSDGKAAGAKFWYVPAKPGNMMVAPGTQMPRYVPDEDPSKPGHTEYFTPADPFSQNTLDTATDNVHKQLLTDVDRLVKRNKTIAETDKDVASTNLTKEETKNQPGIRALHAAEAFKDTQEGMTQGSVRERNFAEAAHLKSEAGLSRPETIQAIGTGHIVPERMSYLLSKDPTLLEDVMKQFPDFVSAKAQAFPALYKKFTEGNIGDQMNSGGAAMEHMKHLMDLNTVQSHIPGTPDYNAYQNQLHQLAPELASFYGHVTDTSIKNYESSLGATLPGNRDSAITDQLDAMGKKFDSFENQWKNGMPSKSFQMPMPDISENQKDARAAIDTNYRNRRVAELGDNTRVQIPGYDAATIPKAAISQFKHDHPDGKVLYSMADDPYAKYQGGSAAAAVAPAPAPSGDDPYAKYGGSSAASTASPTASSAPPAAPSGDSGGIGDYIGPKGAMHFLTGAERGVAKTIIGAKDIAGKVLPSTGPESNYFQGMRQFANAPSANVVESAGEAGENMGEYMLGEGALKIALSTGLKWTEAMKEAVKITEMAKAHPLLAKIITSAAHQGTLTAAQTYLKTGGDAGAAVTQGGIGAVVGGGITGAMEGVANQIAKRASTMEDVGGVPTPITAAQRNARPTPQQTAGQESIKNAAQDALARNLQEVNESRALPTPTRPQLTAGSSASSTPYEFNLQGNPPDVTPATSTPTGQAWVPAAKGRSVGYPAQEGANYSFSGSDLHAQPEYVSSAERVPTTPGNENAMGADVSTTQPRPVKEDIETPESATGAGTWKTQDPNVVREHIATLHRAIDEDPTNSEAYAARRDAQRQMGEYHQHQLAIAEENRVKYPGYQRPNFDQIDIPKTVQKMQSWTQANDYLEKTATDGWQHLNDMTGGDFNAIREDNKRAWDEFQNASTKEKPAAEVALDETNFRMDKLLQSINHAVTPKELSGFADAYKNAQVMRGMSNAVDGSFSGNMSDATKSWEYRGFDGNKLMSNLSRLQQKVGRPALERVVGKQNLDTVFQVAQLNQTPEARAKFGAELVQPVADWLVNNLSSIKHLAPAALGGAAAKMMGGDWTIGAIGGTLAAKATYRVMNSVLTNPKVAENLIFALKSGARPEKFAPLIGTMIQGMSNNKPAGSKPQ